jgi:predicted nucleotidyltransferase
MVSTSPVIDAHLSELRLLCNKHLVARLELFGSAATEQFDVRNSDLDFLVEFSPLSPADRATAYFGLLADLQDLFHRDIDLVELEAVKNPYFKKVVDSQRMVLYAA